MSSFWTSENLMQSQLIVFDACICELLFLPGMYFLFFTVLIKLFTHYLSSPPADALIWRWYPKNKNPAISCGACISLNPFILIQQHYKTRQEHYNLVGYLIRYVMLYNAFSNLFAVAKMKKFFVLPNFSFAFKKNLCWMIILFIHLTHISAIAKPRFFCR